MPKGLVHPDGSSVTPPAGAYYSVKDQPLPAPSTHRGRKRRSCHPCCCCLLWLCGVLVALVLLVGVFALVFWLVVRPNIPHYNVSDVRISGLQANPSDLTMTTETSFVVEARNPNKKIGIYYDRIEVHLATLGLTIGDGDLTPFYQGRKNTTLISGDLKSAPLSLTEVTRAGLLSAGQAGKVPLFLKVEVKARIKIGSWKSPKFRVKVRCNIDVNPNVLDGRQLLDESCSVRTGR